MKHASLVFLTLFVSIVNLEAQQPLDRCEERVAAVISSIRRTCKFKENRKTANATDLDQKSDVYRQLSAGQQLQCGNGSGKKSKGKDDACVTILFCGSRQERPVKTISPKWFNVVNVPDYLPRGDTRPGGRASIEPSNFLLPPDYASANVFRLENPKIDKEYPRAGFIEPVGVERDLRYANEARDAGMLSEAMTHYQRAVKTNPEDSRAILGMGSIYAELGRWQEAEEFYRKAIKSNPLLATAYSGLTYVLLQRSRGGGGSLGLAEAESSAQDAIKLQPMNAVAHDLYGVTMEMKGSLDDAEEAYKQALAIKPNFVIARLHLSRLLRTLGRHAEADRHYARAVADTADPGTLFLMAEKLQSDGDFRKSEAPLERLLATEPDNTSALYLLARALIYRTDYAKGIRILNRIPAVKAKFEQRRLLGFSYLRMNKPEKAEEAFALAAAIGTDEQRKLLAGSTDLQGVAELYLTQKRRQDAVRAYATALSLDPENKWTREAASRIQ